MTEPLKTHVEYLTKNHCDLSEVVKEQQSLIDQLFDIVRNLEKRLNYIYYKDNDGVTNYEGKELTSSLSKSPKIPKYTIPCMNCNGTGKIPAKGNKLVKCPHCKGTGEIKVY